MYSAGRPPSGARDPLPAHVGEQFQWWEHWHLVSLPSGIARMSVLSTEPAPCAHARVCVCVCVCVCVLSLIHI